jgi:hypothetical protein
MGFQPRDRSSPCFQESNFPPRRYSAFPPPSGEELRVESYQDANPLVRDTPPTDHFVNHFFRAAKQVGYLHDRHRSGALLRWEYIRNDAFDAREKFLAPSAKKPSFRQNQFGAAVGGPLEIPRLYNGKKKTFFFVAYQGFRCLWTARCGQDPQWSRARAARGIPRCLTSCFGGGSGVPSIPGARARRRPFRRY